MSFHIAAYAEGFATSRPRALKRSISRVTMAVNTQGTGARESLITRRTDKAIQGLRRTDLGAFLNSYQFARTLLGCCVS